MKYCLLFFLFTVLTSFFSIGQSTYLPLRSLEYQLIERTEALSGAMQNNMFGSLQPVSRRNAVFFLNAQIQQHLYGRNHLTLIDVKNIQRAISISGEWYEDVSGESGAINSKKPIFKYFYQKKADFLHIDNNELFVVINPVIYIQSLLEKETNSFKYINIRGAELRGRIMNRVGFYTFLADNQEKVPNYIEDWETKHSAFPAEAYYRRPGAYDIFMAKGYFDIEAIKNTTNISFGFDKQFVGSGVRSMLLSDNGAPATFLRFSTRWKSWAYENLYMELIPDYVRGRDQILPRKYASIHQLSRNIGNRFNFTLFESTVYENKGVNARYLPPIIFYNTMVRSLGAKQKTSIGFHFKALPFRSVQLYGQALFDNILSKKPYQRSKENRYAAQLGFKYFNAMFISNLDIQTEVNVATPYMYGAYNNVQNYTHYNQPLAHPYGAGFGELIGSLNYQPISKLYLTAKAVYSKRSTDTTTSMHSGNNIFTPYEKASSSNWQYPWSGEKTTNSLYLNLNLAYEPKTNIFIETGIGYLNRSLYSGVNMLTTTYVYGGIRWNISRREFDFY